MKFKGSGPGSTGDDDVAVVQAILMGLRMRDPFCGGFHPSTTRTRRDARIGESGMSCRSMIVGRKGSRRASLLCDNTNKFIYTDDGPKILFNDPETAKDSSGGGAPKGARRGGKRYEVETVTLRNFLEAAEVLRTIDYMSTTAEGDTIDLLERFDFSERDVTLFSITAVDAQQGEALGVMLTRNGYDRRFKAFSMSEDWYVKRDQA